MLVRAFLAEALDPIAHEAARAVLESADRSAGGKAQSHERSSRQPARSTSRAIRARFPDPVADRSAASRWCFSTAPPRAQKPRAVIDAMVSAMETQYANVHRGLHWMSERTTDAYEATRDAVARADQRAATATRSCSRATAPRRSTSSRTATAAAAEAGAGGGDLGDGAPLQYRAVADAARRARHRIARRADHRRRRTRHGGVRGVAARTARSASSPSRICPTCSAPTRRPRGSAALAHAHGAKVLFDGSPGDRASRASMCRRSTRDFYVFTGHKLYGPTGIGVLWARRELLEAMPPFLGGGDMISSVTFERRTWARVPHKFEAGTPAILEVIGLKRGDPLRRSDRLRGIAAHEAALTEHALARLSAHRGRARSSARRRIAAAWSRSRWTARTRTMSRRCWTAQGIAVRAGHHCAEPLMHRLGLDSTARASFGVYTTHERDRRAGRND